MMAIIADSAQVLIRWIPDQALNLGGFFHVYKDAQNGVVDYSARINPSAIAAWPDSAGKMGAGLGRAGYGPAGFGEGGLGAGLGACGYGPAGFDANWLTFTTPKLADGDWTFAVAAFDAAENPSPAAGGTEAEATLAGEPEEPASLVAETYAAGVLTMTLGLSPDDEGA